MRYFPQRLPNPLPQWIADILKANTNVVDAVPGYTYKHLETAVEELSYLTLAHFFMCQYLDNHQSLSNSINEPDDEAKKVMEAAVILYGVSSKMDRHVPAKSETGDSLQIGLHWNIPAWRLGPFTFQGFKVSRSLGPNRVGDPVIDEIETEGGTVLNTCTIASSGITIDDTLE